MSMDYSRLKTPCYFFDRNEFEKNIVQFKRALRDSFGANWVLSYSFKTNYLPYVLLTALESGCYAEVVSDKEYLVAKRIGFRKNRIVFNGPMKGKAQFLESIRNDCIVNIDSKREIEWLGELDSSHKYSIGVRVNLDIEKDLPGHALMGEEGGRFGFCDENGELSRAIERIKQYGNIEINCLHMHVSSKTKSIVIYQHLVKKACDIINREHLKVKYIDVGGSFFGGGDDGSAYRGYIKEIRSTLIECNKEEIGIVVEPGASLIASCVSYVVEVIDTKKTTRNNYVVTDGSRLHIDPFFAKKNFTHMLISEESTTEKMQTIVGFTCMEKDIILRIADEKELSIGDRIVFYTVGSYTVCLNSDFISSEPRVYAKKGDKIYLVRSEKNIDTFFINNTVEELD